MTQQALPDRNALSLDALYAELSSTGLVRRLLALARDEDLSPGNGEPGDITSLQSTDATPVQAAVVARESMRVAGTVIIPELLTLFAPSCTVKTVISDGTNANAGDTLAQLQGPRQELLVAERTLLNLVSRLCGVATRTALFVDCTRDTKASIYDTRKTTPGLRVLEKYAVRCGGGMCHRFGLYDAMLLKDNHLAGIANDALASHIKQVCSAARSSRPLRFVMVETDTLEQLSRVLEVETGVVDIVLLDNMPPKTLREAVRLRDAHNPALQLEASGGINLDTVRTVAETGVDRISVGSLTRDAVSPDIGLDIC